MPSPHHYRVSRDPTFDVYHVARHGRLTGLSLKLSRMNNRWAIFEGDHPLSVHRFTSRRDALASAVTLLQAQEAA